MKRKALMLLGIFLAANMFTGAAADLIAKADVNQDIKTEDASEEYSSEYNIDQNSEGIDSDTVHASQIPVVSPTEAPADTSIPATEAPATVAPSNTEIPAVQTPTGTKIPATQAPISTDTPATQIPSGTKAPATHAPVSTGTPATQVPSSTKAPVTQVPVSTGTPATQVPSGTKAPATQAPVSTDTPATQVPAGTKAPATHAPVSTATPVAQIPTGTEIPATQIPAGTSSPAPTVSPAPDIVMLDGWHEVKGKYYWYEDGIIQGTEGRGKEIYDPDSQAWYWLNGADGGAMAVNIDVYQDVNGGKWVYYGEDGRRVSGEVYADGAYYYYEPMTGAMVKGPMILPDGRKVFYDLETGRMVKGTYQLNEFEYHFDTLTGNLIDEPSPELWLSIDGSTYLYRDWVRQGWKPDDPEYVGEEVNVSGYDYWLNGSEQGRIAIDELVTLPDGRVVYYDLNGHMYRGWSADKMYYFDQYSGNLERGTRIIGSMEYVFDAETGIKLSESRVRGFEVLGLSCNVEAGKEYNYITRCYSNEDIPIAGKAVFNYQVFTTDATHPAKDGYEWKKVTVSTTYSGRNVQQYGCQYALLYDLDYYTLENTSVSNTPPVETAIAEKTVNYNGFDYPVTSNYEVLSTEWIDEESICITVSYECQVPVGYDGMVVAFYNAANRDAAAPLDKLDSASLIFRME